MKKDITYRNEVRLPLHTCHKKENASHLIDKKIPTATTSTLLAIAFCLSITGVASCGLDSDTNNRSTVTPPQTLTTASTSNGRNYSNQNLSNYNFHAEPAGSLVNATFENSDLTGANFSGQDLTGANFNNANLGPSSFGTTQFTQTKLHKTTFVGAIINATDFTFSDIQCADFSHTSLLQANFGPYQNITAGDGCRTNFSYATMDVNAINSSNWGKTDFTYTNFQNVTPSNFSLSGKDISNAILVGARFDGINISSANLTAVDFSHASLVRANLTNSAMNGVQLILADLSYATMVCTRFYGAKNDGSNNPNAAACPNTVKSSLVNKAANLTQATFNGTVLSNSTLNNAILNGAVFSGAVLKQASFISANLEATEQIMATSMLGSDLSGAYFNGAKINSVQFTNLIMPNVDFSNTNQQGTMFTGSILPKATFDGASLQSVSFDNAVLQGAKFTNTTMKTTPDGGGTGVTFNCSQLGGADFKNATVTSASFNVAVMPAAGACCPEKADFTWCGTIDATQQPYGPVTFPVLTSPQTCPNGKIRQCADTDWSIPGWQTNRCNAAHVTEPVWSKPPCDVPPQEIVHFDDLRLKSCITSALPGKPSEVSIQTARTIHEVICPGLGITSTVGLEQFTKLFKLDLTANKLTQLQLPLMQLQTLLVSNNQLTLLDVSKNTALVQLNAANNHLKSVQHLDIVPGIEVLDLSSNELTDIDLAVQDSLLFADLSNNKLTNILDQFNTTLDRLQSLAYLDLSHNSLTNIGSLTTIAYSETKNPNGSLNSLQLECNQTFECASIELDGHYDALHTSQCAQFNSADNQWIVTAHPYCQK